MNIRTLRVRWIVLIAFAVSSSIVLDALPKRNRGLRTAEEAYIPLRLMPEDAAFLIANEYASVTIDGADVILVTSVFPIRREDGSYGTESASWENYDCSYRVRRDVVEAVLRRPVRAVPARYPPDPISHSSDHLPRYIAVEVAFLTVWLTALVLSLRRIRRVTAVLPVLWPFLVAPMYFVVRFYSPAFLDADYFHQRIVLETVALWSFVAGMRVYIPAGVSLAVWIVIVLMDRVARVHALRSNES